MRHANVKQNKKSKKPKDKRRYVNPRALQAQIEYFTALHVTGDGPKLPPLAEGLLQMLNDIKKDLEIGRECVLEFEE